MTTLNREDAAHLAAPLVEEEARSCLFDLILPDDLMVECPGGLPPMCVGYRDLSSDMLVVIGVHVGGRKSSAVVVQRIHDTFMVVTRDATPDGDDLIVCATPSWVLPEEWSRPDTFTFRVFWSG